MELEGKRVDADGNVIVDAEVTEIKTDWWHRTLRWVANHKVLVCCSVIGLPIILIWIGAKAFSTTKEVKVEVMPDPTIWDRYEAIPVNKYEKIEYEFVPKEVKAPTTTD